MNTFARLAVLLGCLFLSFPLMSQTADGETPSQESVCDGLLADGVTSGLFGLCNAYCEAQDCDSYAEGEAPSSCSSLLASYSRRAGDGDPAAMPCSEPQEAACPCWSQEEYDSVTAEEFPFQFCAAGEGLAWELTILQSTTGVDQVWFSSDPTGALGCLYINTRYPPDDPPDDPAHPFERMRLGISVEEDAACRADIRERCGL